MAPFSELSRRGFLGAGATAGAAGFVSAAPAGAAARPAEGPARIELGEDGVLRIETGTLTARIDKGFLTSLRSKSSGEEYIRESDRGRVDALQLIYRNDETVNVGEQKFGRIETRKVSDQRAEVIFQNWDGDGVLSVSVDPESGDLVIEPSAYSSRPGIRSCRWLLKGIRPGLRLVAPFYQGVSLEFEDKLIHDTTWRWPRSWEAGLVILQGSNEGFWVHTQDSRYGYKALKVGDEDSARQLAFDTEAYGPIDGNLAAGGLAWRINVHDGDWRTPAARYRDWLWEAYSLEHQERLRPDWVQKLRLALSWCPNEIGILERLAERVDPNTVLMHFHNWRVDDYDENYPHYVASSSAAAFLERANELGFHVMPHFNTLEVDPNHAVYNRVRDFQYRDVETKRLQGWSWVNRTPIGVPESNASRLDHRDEKVMVKIHPGLSTWRSLLRDRIRQAAEKHDLNTVFVDVALNTMNLHDCLVEGMTSTEGMNRLLRGIVETGDGLAVGAEGLNEIIFQGMSAGQVHLFRSFHDNFPGLERTGGCPLNNFLFGRLCRSFGYSGLGGRNEEEELRARIHEEHEALPTITIRSAEELVDPTPAVRRALEQAGS